MLNKISIIAIGKLPSEYKDLSSHYLKMIGKLEITEIVIKKNLSEKEALQSEGKEILSKIKPSQKVILLDVVGKSLDSHKFAKMLGDINQDICFVIGGAYGVSEDLKRRAAISISLSDLTFPHMLARIILLEQIYRAKSILVGHPYHKD